MRLFRQPDAARRLALTRLTAAAAVLRYVAHLPDGQSFAELNRFAAGAGTRAGGARPYARRVNLLKAVTIGSVAAWAVGVAPRTAGIAAVSGFALLNREVAVGLPGFGSYTSHLNFMLAASVASDSHRHLSLAARRSAPASAAGSRVQAAQLATMQVFVATTYLQAGLSKMRHGGRRWVTEPNTLAHALAVYGTPAGRAMSRRTPLMRPMAAATVAFETGFLPALLVGFPSRRMLGLGALGFHASIKHYMDISFWHLAWFHVPLFVAPTSLATIGRRSRRRRPGAETYGRRP